MQGQVFHVPVGENFKLEAQSQAHHSRYASIHLLQTGTNVTQWNELNDDHVLVIFVLKSIHDFQVSGPDGMTKQFADKANGKAKLTLSWTPQGRDLHRATPVCFTAETNETWGVPSRATGRRGKELQRCCFFHCVYRPALKCHFCLSVQSVGHEVCRSSGGAWVVSCSRSVNLPWSTKSKVDAYCQ